MEKDTTQTDDAHHQYWVKMFDNFLKADSRNARAMVRALLDAGVLRAAWTERSFLTEQLQAYEGSIVPIAKKELASGLSKFLADNGTVYFTEAPYDRGGVTIRATVLVAIPESFMTPEHYKKGV